MFSMYDNMAEQMQRAQQARIRQSLLGGLQNSTTWTSTHLVPKPEIMIPYIPSRGDQEYHIETISDYLPIRTALQAIINKWLGTWEK